MNCRALRTNPIDRAAVFGRPQTLLRPQDANLEFIDHPHATSFRVPRPFGLARSIERTGRGIGEETDVRTTARLFRGLARARASVVKSRVNAFARASRGRSRAFARGDARGRRGRCRDRSVGTWSIGRSVLTRSTPIAEVMTHKTPPPKPPARARKRRTVASFRARPRGRRRRATSEGDDGARVAGGWGFFF